MNQSANWIAYDGECPFCSAYIRMVRLREAVGPVTLINVRDDVAVYRELVDQGFDMDEGMVLKMNGRYFYGADAIHAISLLSSPSGLFNRINAMIFRSKGLSTILYPVLKAGRRLTLTLLGRKKINETYAK
ncbi:MAG TPA: DUF393 domain-containing protein [Dongiaceae bacterium]|nr:DUF393 domain-containing protein [Dongiaceae bacterium]